MLHGWGGSDFPHWQSWLAGEIAKDYGTVSFLRFSNPDFPDLGMWKKELKEHMEDFRPDIVICHSLANILWFHLCNEDDFKDVAKLYLVAPPKLDSKIKELQSFFPVTIPTNPHAKEILLIVSTNDNYMTLQEAQTLEQSLDVPILILENAGHINAQSGYGEWPWILEELHK